MPNFALFTSLFTPGIVANMGADSGAFTVIGSGVTVGSVNDHVIVGNGPFQTVTILGAVIGVSQWTIYLEGTRPSVTIQPGGLVANLGENPGTNAAIAMLPTTSSLASILNAGTIQGAEFAILGSLNVGGGLSLVNSGAIHGTVVMGNGSNAVLNTGTIFNDLYLGSDSFGFGQIGFGPGNNEYDGRGGQALGWVMGGEGNDRILAGDNDDLLFGGLGGNDDIRGRGGDDLIYALAGNDTLRGGAGDDTMMGGADDDLLQGGAGDDLLFGNAGNDTLIGGGGEDTLAAGAGVDVLTGGSGRDIFVWVSADDIGTGVQSDRITDFESGVDKIDLSGFGVPLTFIGTAAFSGSPGEIRFNQNSGTLQGDISGNGSADFRLWLDGVTSLTADDLILSDGFRLDLRGMARNDLFYGAEGGDLIEGRGGNDIIDGRGGNDSLFGGDGDDLLFGGAGDDFLDGGAGNDVLQSGGGNDTLMGGDGNDQLFTSGSGTNQVYGQDGIDIVQIFGNNDMAFGGDGNDVMTAFGSGELHGDSGSDSLLLNGANGVAYGGADDDVIQVIGANGVAYGGSGNDFIQAFNDAEIHGDDGNDFVQVLGGTALVFGGDGNDSISGGSGNDTLFGDTGRDSILGGGGNDVIDTGNGVNASIAGGLTFTGTSNTDPDLYPVFLQAGTIVTFDIDGGTVPGAATGNFDSVIALFGPDEVGPGFQVAGNDDAGGAEPGSFSNLDSFITYSVPTDGVYTLQVRELTQTGFASSTATYVLNIQEVGSLADGGSDDDHITGGDARDTLQGGFGNDTLLGLQSDDTLYGGDGNDELRGGAGDDVMFGGDGNDILRGGAGIDWLYGGEGADTLIGGSGADIFFFNSAAEIGTGGQSDRITDFQTGVDKINLAPLGPGLTFIGTDPFSGVAGQVRFNPSGQVLQGDMDGDGSLDFRLFLDGVTTLTADDFFLT